MGALCENNWDFIHRVKGCETPYSLLLCNARSHEQRPQWRRAASTTGEIPTQALVRSWPLEGHAHSLETTPTHSLTRELAKSQLEEDHAHHQMTTPIQIPTRGPAKSWPLKDHAHNITGHAHHTPASQWGPRAPASPRPHPAAGLCALSSCTDLSIGAPGAPRAHRRPSLCFPSCQAPGAGPAARGRRSPTLGVAPISCPPPTITGPKE